MLLLPHEKCLSLYLLYREIGINCIMDKKMTNLNRGKLYNESKFHEKAWMLPSRPLLNKEDYFELHISKHKQLAMDRPALSFFG